MSDKSDEHYKAEPSIWMRGLFMLIFAVFFGLAETVLLAIAVVQFLWMIFAKEKNQALADFGVSVGKWLSQVAAFQTAATEEKPFPWGKWE
ncbi:MAG: DUF4389 domain-containing protein [Rhodobacterales bacterium]|jgi:hypothetical protein|nr:DUF4389 domain-containing protein [Pseudomonadota bacterium]MDA1287286.1 DUF4389 domain-containing protein [Pseudomonadota bacterium]HBN32189.1 DUF4389 domain-containing protein [Paracoccaceae bacterium]